MSELVRIATVTDRREARHARRHNVHSQQILTVSRYSLEDAIEDAQLNAIADERSDGPFVRVSLDDL